jgi:acetyl esterase/lipase
MTLTTDPRVNPKMRQALMDLGIAENQASGIPEDFTVESMTPFLEQLDKMSVQLYETFENELSSDVDEPEIEKTALTIKGVDDNDIKLCIYKPVGANAAGSLPAVLYYHGGAMLVITTDNKVHNRWLRSLAVQGVIAISVDFRNAYTPVGHNPFPAGLNDCAAAAKYIAEHRAELGISKVILQGESGGANLSITTALKANREGWIDQIAGVYGTAPYISGAYNWSRERKLKELPSLIENDGYMLPISRVSAMAYYYGPDDLKNPHAWPLLSSIEELKGLPSFVLDMNELDPLRDEGIAFYHKLVNAGVKVDAKVTLGIVHGAALLYRKALPEVHNASARDVAAFAKSLSLF